MRPLRTSWSIALVYAPLALTVGLTALTGGSIRAPYEIPVSLSPLFFLSGGAMVLGAVAGLFYPKCLETILVQEAPPSWWQARGHLFTLVFGSMLVLWSALSVYGARI
jgi:hypothetical protein